MMAPLQEQAVTTDDGMTSEHEMARVVSAGNAGAAILSLQRRAGNRAAERWLHRDALSESGIQVPPVAQSLLRTSGGRPLPLVERRSLESRLGVDLSDVRLHADETANGAADAVGASAFTVGQDIVFGSGKYAPGTLAGEDLMLHEITHFVHQTQAQGIDDRLFMQPNEEQGVAGRVPEAIPVPGTGLTAFPRFGGSASLLGVRLPLPASLTLTNALSAGTAPSFVLNVAPNRLVLGLLQSIDLSSSVRPGTPPGQEGLPANQQRVRILRPIVSLNTESGRLSGAGVLSIDSGYPEVLKGPTNIDVDVISTELGRFSGRLGYGPLNADFKLRLHYDTSRLATAASPVLNLPQGFEGLWARFQSILTSTIPGVDLSSHREALRTILRSAQAGRINTAGFVSQTLALAAATVRDDATLAGLRQALSNFAAELTHPGFTASGSVSLGPLPLTAFGATAPTTRPRAQPLLGAPTSFPVQYGAAGVVLAPAGSIFETPVPALGAVGGTFGERAGAFGSAGLLPSLSLSAISGGEPAVNQFPVYLYAEITGVTRVSAGLELGIRLTAQVNTPQLFGPRAGPQTPQQRFESSLKAYQEASREGGTPAPAVPNVGLTVFGRFAGP